MINESTPIELVKLTEHLQNERIKRGLSKRSLAKLLNVGLDTIIDWKYGRRKPPPRYAKAIIDFLGYVPFDDCNRTLGQQMYHARLVAGKTQKQLAEIIGCSELTIAHVETDKIKPQKSI